MIGGRSGWFGESHRHYLASKGVKTGFFLQKTAQGKYNPAMWPSLGMEKETKGVQSEINDLNAQLQKESLDLRDGLMKSSEDSMKMGRTREAVAAAIQAGKFEDEAKEFEEKYKESSKELKNEGWKRKLMAGIELDEGEKANLKKLDMDVESEAVRPWKVGVRPLGRFERESLVDKKEDPLRGVDLIDAGEQAYAASNRARGERRKELRLAGEAIADEGFSALNENLDKRDKRVKKQFSRSGIEVQEEW